MRDGAAAAFWRWTKMGSAMDEDWRRYLGHSDMAALGISFVGREGGGPWPSLRLREWSPN